MAVDAQHYGIFPRDHACLKASRSLKSKFKRGWDGEGERRALCGSNSNIGECLVLTAPVSPTFDSSHKLLLLQKYKLDLFDELYGIQIIRV